MNGLPLRSFLLLGLSFIYHRGLAQQTPPSLTKRLSMAYSGETITHYGVNLAYQRYFPARETRRSHLFYGLNVTGYRHQKNHIGILALPELGYAYVAPTGLRAELSVQAGYMRRFYDGVTFSVDDQGRVRKRPWAGSNSVAYGFSLLAGWDFGHRPHRRTGLFVQPKLLWEYPYNNRALIHPFVDIGLSRLF